jgi:hypothetical protein
MGNSALLHSVTGWNQFLNLLRLFSFAYESHENYSQSGGGPALRIRPSTADTHPMILIAKIILVVMAVFGQEHLFREKPESLVESTIDSLKLPVHRPELVLAKRAMEAQGLCPANPSQAVVAARIDTSSSPDPEANDTAEDLAYLCP